MHDLEKTAVFHAFRAGALDEMEKIATEQGLTHLEKVALLSAMGNGLQKVAIFGAIGKGVASMTKSFGQSLGQRGSKVMAGRAAKAGGEAVKAPWHIGAANRLGDASKWMAARPGTTGGLALGGAGLGAAGLTGAGFAAGGAAGEGHQAVRRAVRG